MSVEFNKNLLLDNIVYLVKERNLKIGEVETQAGVSPGYISRNRDGNTKPGIEFIINIANVLNIGIDTLLFVDLSALTPTEKYLIGFLKKLNKDTSEDKLNWNIEKQGYLNNLETDYEGQIDHPLFQYGTIYGPGETGYPEVLGGHVYFNSASFGEDTIIGDECYNLRLKNGTILYLMCVEKEKPGTTGADSAKEIWMFKPYSGSEYICSNDSSMPFSHLVDSLYSAVKENSRHPKVKQEIKYVIDAFMKDDLNDDLPADMMSDDLPF